MLRNILGIVCAVVAVLAAYVGVYLLANQSGVARRADIAHDLSADAPMAGEALEILVWNLGYGGLGADSDFIADGGKNILPPSRTAARVNVAGIAQSLGDQLDADVVLLQEIARASPLNYHVDLKREVDAALEAPNRLFFADFKTRLLPWPLRFEHGQAIYARSRVTEYDVVALPAEDQAILGVKRRYASLVARLPMESGAGWTIASVHLAAFDEDAAVRTRQLRQLMTWAQTEYQAGRHVVIGGDWNLQLVETSFPHTTLEKDLFWLYPFPQDALPEGWRIGADASVPSVRTNERPYRPGENYTTVIDGFIVSPNVEIENVRGIDLGFLHADHQPVRIRVRAR